MSRESAIPIRAIVAALFLAFLVGGIATVGCIRREIQQSMKHFRQRHLEATQAIEHTYVYFRDHGHWPTKTDVELASQQLLPREWEYESDPTLGGPIIWLHGPNHMILSYRFAPPRHGAVSNTWVLSIEGDKNTFVADVGYSLESPPEPARHLGAQ